MSMSIPFFFRPARYREVGGERRNHWIMDGGMLSNFPIWLFDSPVGAEPAWPSIGFLLWEPGADQPRHQRIRGPVSMTLALVKTMSGAMDRKAIAEVDAVRIVKIPTGTVATTDFDLPSEQREWLHRSGYEAAQAFLESLSFEDYKQLRKEQAP